MGLRKALFLSVLFLPLSLLAESADDYAHRGAQKYIFGDDEGAKSEVANGLAKFPNDKELQEMVKLFQEKNSGGKGNKKQQNQQQQSQQNQDQQDQNQNQQQNQDNNQSGNGSNQQQQQQRKRAACRAGFRA